MDFEWVAIASSDVFWILIAFSLGLLSKYAGLPAMVGFLAAGFILNALEIGGGDTLEFFSDLGITLLLFTVGLKLNIRTLARPQVWAVTGLHTSIVICTFTGLIYGLAIAGAPFFSSLTLEHALLIAFALSFSSTVFVVKVLEEKGEVTSLHGRIAVGILIMQDLLAVVFLAVSAGKWPSLWALSIVLLIPLRPVLQRLLKGAGHGELLILLGFLLALGGAEVFELVGLKGDLGALILGVMIASHPKAEELAKAMLGFKDLFLLGFFLSIGMSGNLTLETLIVGVLVAPLILVKSALFYSLFTGFKLRARTSLLATLNLSNFSEFGLIVVAVGVANSWISNDWLIILAVAMSLSFVFAAAMNKISHQLYTQNRPLWRRLQRSERLTDDRVVDIKDASIAIIGMGVVGTGAYDKLSEQYGESVIGVDIDPVTVKNHRASGRHVLLGDPSDADFWDRVEATHTLELVMLALPKLDRNLAVINEIRSTSISARIAATAKFSEDIETLERAGANTVFNMYTEAGAGFASHVTSSA